MSGEPKPILNFSIKKLGTINSKKLILTLIVLLFSNTIFAQSITGVVNNEQGFAVGSASIIIKDTENKTVAYQFTKTNGSFSFTNLENKEYTLQCNALGYERQTITIDLSTEKSKELTITLQEKTEELQEIVIDIPTPIKQKNDTVTFNVKAFLDGTEYTVEDLLKKLPTPIIPTVPLFFLGQDYWTARWSHRPR